MVTSLPVAGIAIACGVRLFLAHERAGLCVGVPPHAFLVVDTAVGVQPDDLVPRAMLLRGGFRGEKL